MENIIYKNQNGVFFTTKEYQELCRKIKENETLILQIKAELME